MKKTWIFVLLLSATPLQASELQIDIDLDFDKFLIPSVWSEPEFPAKVAFDESILEWYESQIFWCGTPGYDTAYTMRDGVYYLGNSREVIRFSQTAKAVSYTPIYDLTRNSARQGRLERIFYISE